MSQIRPVSDLRNNFADISHTVHETGEPVILTRNGYGDMVVLAYDEYQKIQYEMGVMRELRAAELESETTHERYDHDDVMRDLRARVRAARYSSVNLNPGKYSSIKRTSGTMNSRPFRSFRMPASDAKANFSR